MCALYPSVYAPPFFSLSPRLPLFLCVFVGKSLLVRLPHRQQAHTHTPIKESFLNLDLCSLSSSLIPYFPPSPVCLFVCGPNALNFYFRLSQFTQANGKKYFSFGWLPCLACLLLTGPSCASNYARGASVCCYYVYVTLRYAYATCSMVSTV